MKTFIYLPTLLALIIPVMVNGQTQDNQARKIRVDIMGPKEPVKMNYTNSNVTMSMTEYNQLLEQVNELKVQATKLKEEIASVEYASLVKQVEASEMSSRISLHAFEHNKNIILQVFPKIPTNTTVFSKAQHSYTESERFMKLAKEMREEASAQLTIQARYGNMTNAEEKETQALAKQQEVLNLFETHYPQLLKQTLEIANAPEETIIPEEERVLVSDNERALLAMLNDNLIQLENMKITAQQLRANAEQVSPNQKCILTEEAISLESDYLLKQLEVATIKSALNHYKFSVNRELIASLTSKVSDNESLVNKAIQLNGEAEYLMKIGTEMREEANAQLTNAAKYGASTNAEEKEILALQKQSESIAVIENYQIKTFVAIKY